MNFFENVLSVFAKIKDNKLILKQNQFIELTDSNGVIRGALLVHDLETKNSLLKHLQISKDKSYAGHNGNISDVIIDKLGATGAMIASGIQAGNLMQIIGTPALMEGLRTGTMSLMSTSVGSTGTVISSTGTSIVGQLRFAPANIVPVIAPLAIWHVINAIAGVRQLSKINARLEKLQRSVDSIIFRMQANAYGRLSAVIASLNEIGKQHRTIGYFSDDMSTRLAIATQEIHTVFFEQRFLIQRFTEESKAIIKNTKKKEGAHSANQLLKKEEQSFIIDASIYIAAARASLLASKSWLVHDLEKVPEYVASRNDAIQQEVSQVEKSMEPLSTIEELKEHSIKCINEMGWFSKNIFNIELNKDIQNRSDQTHREQLDTTQDTEPSILIWKGEDGKLNCINIECKIE